MRIDPAPADTPCPVCGRAAQAPCIAAGGKVLRQPHVARAAAVEAARAAFQARVDALPPPPPPSPETIAKADAMLARMLGPQRRPKRPPPTQLPLL